MSAADASRNGRIVRGGRVDTVLVIRDHFKYIFTVGLIVRIAFQGVDVSMGADDFISEVGARHVGD